MNDGEVVTRRAQLDAAVSFNQRSVMQKKLRISFIIPWITQSRGGTENVGQLMANAMAARGHEVRIYTFDDQRRPSVWMLDKRIKLHWLAEDVSPSEEAQAVISLAEPCPDLIVGLHMNRTLLRYAKFAEKLQIPIVLSEHIDPHFPERLGVFDSSERIEAIAGSTIFHILNNNFAATVPEDLRNRICVVPNTVAEIRRRADPIGQKKKALIVVARLVPRKNLARLIDEFSMICDEFSGWELNILGDGPEEKALKMRARRLGIAKRVNFFGFSDNPYSYLEDSQIFVLPSLFEGFPMSSLEAMAHGLPLVGYAACNGLNEQVEDGVNGLLAQRSLEKGSLAACLRSLMADSSKRLEMGNASRRRFETFYSNEIIFGMWEDMFLKAYNIGPNLS